MVGPLYRLDRLGSGYCSGHANKARTRQRSGPRLASAALDHYFLFHDALRLSAALPPAHISQYCSSVALGILILGLTVRWIAILSLGKAFSANVAIRSTQRIYQAGLYSLVRHPFYSGLLLVFLAVGLHSRNAITLLCAFVPPTAALLYRIHVEELALQAAFGNEYRAYMTRTKRGSIRAAATISGGRSFAIPAVTWHNAKGSRCPAVLTLSIRNAIAGDEEIIVSLWRACGLATSYNDLMKDFRFARASSNSDILVGVSPEGQIVGSVMVGHDGHRGWLYYVAAAPGHRLQGIGKQMVAAAEEWLRDRKVAKVMLLVRDTNGQVVEFYSRVGFEAVPRVVMQKWLI